jgi:RimJ/RimL family protein N-acetyltransferase
VPPIDRPCPQNVSIRPAEPHEAGLVRSIDDSVFPEQSEDLQRAPADELEDGIDAKDVYVYELGGQVVGYLHVNRTDSRLIYLSGFGILPELQNRGLGTVMAGLAQPILEEYEHKLPIYTVTSPRNARMLRVLFNLRFAGRWVLPDYFGPGRHRIGCQLLRRASVLKESARTRQIRLADIHGLDRMVQAGWVIRDQRKGRTGQFFELAAASDEDFLACLPPPGRSGFTRIPITAVHDLT